MGSPLACKKPESTALADRPLPHVRSAEVRRVKPRPGSRHLVLLEPERRARLAPRMGGQVIDIAAREQQAVQAGMVLAKLAADDSRGNLMAAKATIARIGESIADNERELNTARQLQAKGVESDRAVERLATTERTLKAQLREAKGQLVRAKDKSSAATIDAPFDGTVTEVITELGEYLAPGSPAFVLAQLDPLALEIPLTEREIVAHDAGGLRFEVVIRGDVRPATLEWIASEAEAGTSTFPARVKIDNPGQTLRAGESATVKVYAEGTEPVLAVPMTAVRWAAKQSFVLRLTDANSDSKLGEDPGEESENAKEGQHGAAVERVDITVLDDAGELVAIEGPVEPGDHIVTAGPTALVSGDEVVVVASPAETLAAR